MPKSWVFTFLAYFFHIFFTFSCFSQIAPDPSMKSIVELCHCVQDSQDRAVTLAKTLITDLDHPHNYRNRHLRASPDQEAEPFWA